MFLHWIATFLTDETPRISPYEIDSECLLPTDFPN